MLYLILNTLVNAYGEPIGQVTHTCHGHMSTFNNMDGRCATDAWAI